MDVISEQDRSTRNPRRSSGNSSSSRSGSATDRCRQELDDYDVDFDVRPPSGTNHQVSSLEDRIKFDYAPSLKTCFSAPNTKTNFCIYITKTLFQLIKNRTFISLSN